MGFREDLDRYGPGQNVWPDLPAARAYCKSLARRHYENFSVLSWFTPPTLRSDFAAVYAFCRWADDLGDELDDPERSLALLSWWRGELKGLYEGRARHPVMVALQETVERHAIPPEPFEALISAFEQDQSVHEYKTYSQLLDYCTRSANPVGHLVLHLTGDHALPRVRLSDATCTALQLANFWQDVRRDLAIGRIYLPEEDRTRFGVTREMLERAPASPEFRRLMAYEVERARGLFEEGRPLVNELSGRVAVAVELFTRGGIAILERIERQDYDVLSRRPRIGRLAKLGLMIQAVAGPRLASIPHLGGKRGGAGTAVEAGSTR
jgi:squalene synthase HpnC